MNRLSAQNQMIIAVAAIVVMAVAVVFLAIMPAFQRATQIDTEIAKVTSDIQAEQAVLDRRKSAKAQSADNQVEMLRIANQVPESPELPTLIVDLQDTANAAGLDFTQLAPSAPIAVANASGQPVGYSSIPISMIVNGDWADQIEFLRKIDKLSRGIRIKSCAYSYRPETEAEDAAVIGTISLEVYTMAVVQTNVSTATQSNPATPPAGATPAP